MRFNIFKENRELKQEVSELRDLTFGGVTIPSFGGITGVPAVNEKTVSRIPTAEACLKLITGSIAQMPVYLYKDDGKGNIEKVKEYDKRVNLLNHENEFGMSATDFKKLMVTDFVLHGQAHALMEKEKETIPVNGIVEQIEELSELNHLPASNLQVEVYHNGIKYTGATYTMTTITGTPTNRNTNQAKFNADQLLRVLNNPTNAYQAEGVLVRGKDIFEQALAEMEYTRKLYNSGAMPQGLLKTAARLSQPAVDRLRDSWNALYSGIRNTAKTVILEEGMDYQKLQLNPNEMQIGETSERTNAEICRLFGVPESMVSSKANKYGSLEQNQLHFYKHCLAPIIISFEAALDRQLLTEAEKRNGYCFRFDTTELLRTTEGERTDTLVKQINAGLITTNEARFVIDRKPSANGNDLRLSLGHVLMNTETGEIKVPNVDGGTKQNE